MATVTIARPAAKAPPAPKHPRAYIATDTGLKVALPFAPVESSIGGLADPFETLDRPGRRPLLRRSGDSLPTVSFTVVLARTDNQSSVHGEITMLREIAYSGARVTVGGLSSYEAGPWRMTGCDVTILARAYGSNRVTRAEVAITLTTDSDVTIRPSSKGPTTGGHKTPKPKPKHKPKPVNRYYTLRRGETLSHVALKFYGDPNAWKPIATASKIRNVRSIPAGKRLTIPPRK